MVGVKSGVWSLDMIDETTLGEESRRGVGWSKYPFSDKTTERELKCRNSFLVVR